MHVGAQLVLLATAAIWGWTFVIVKESVQEVTPFLFLFTRFTLATVVLVLIFRKPLLETLNWKIIWRGSLIGSVLGAGYLFQTWGLIYTSATKSGFITGVSVVLVPLMGFLFRERIATGAWLGTAFSFIGLSLILLGPTLSSAKPISEFAALFFELNQGDLLTLLCALSFAAHILLIGHWVDPQNYRVLLVLQIAATAVFSLAGAFLFERVHLEFSLSVWYGIGITGLLATALAFWAQNKFQPLSTPTRTAIIFSTEPLFAALFGSWLLSERLEWTQWIGAGLIVLGIIISQLPSRAVSSRV
jgi:drug/metabolite transporter (DMT)-like permease